MSDNNDNRLSAAYSVAEAELYQAATLTSGEFAVFMEEGDAGKEKLGAVVAKRRGWFGAEFSNIEQKKDGSARIVYRRVDSRHKAG